MTAVAKSASYLLGAILVLPLIALLLPLLYAMGWMLLVTLIPLCLGKIVKDAWSEPEQRRELFRNLGLMLVVLPAMLLAFMAPCRAVLLMLASWWPSLSAVTNEIHAWLYGPLRSHFGVLAPYWMDFYWGIYAVLIALIAAYLDSMRRNMLVSQVALLPTSKVRSVPVGLAELSGKALPVDPGDKYPIARYWIETSGEGSRIEHYAKAFYLDDGSGRILIEPAGSSVKSEHSMFSIGLHQVILKAFEAKSGFPEGRLLPGDTVYVLGNVQINPDYVPGDPESGTPLLVRPARTSLLRMNFYDLFFVSNISEQALLRAFRASIARGWYGVFMFMAISGWLSIYAWTNITQLETLELDAPPAYFRALSTPTDLERELYVFGHGSRRTIDWLRELAREELVPSKKIAGGSAGSGRPRKDPNANIVSSLNDAGLIWLALPMLREAAGDLDHRNFAVANKWLARLDQAGGRWGTIYFTDDAAAGYETYVTRAALRYEQGRVSVSARAYFSEQRRPKNDTIAARKLVFELTDARSGAMHRAEFPAAPGWKRIDEAPAFENLAPGPYRFDVYAKTEYGSGRFDRGSRKRKPSTLSF